MSKENELEKALESKFFCPSKFAENIESLVLNNKDMNYIDAIIHFCEQNNIDIESVPKLISKPLKEKIKCDAQELNFMKRTSRAKLPVWGKFDFLFQKSRKKKSGKKSPHYLLAWTNYLKWRSYNQAVPVR